MIDVIVFKPGHLDFIVPKDCFNTETDIKNRIELLYNNGANFIHTFIVNSKPAAVVGGLMLFPHLAEVWSLTSYVINESPKEFVSACQRLLTFYEKSLNIYRYQSIVKSNYDTGIRFVESLGFHLEALMQGYMPDFSDAYLYARLNNADSD